MNLNPSILLIQLTGIVQLLIALANFFAPAKLRYRENLVKLSLIVRQIFIVHSIYIVLVLIGFALICLFFPEDLAGASPLGRFLCRCLALFWGLRAALQFFYYEPGIKRENPLGTLCFGTAFLFLATVFIAISFRMI